MAAPVPSTRTSTKGRFNLSLAKGGSLFSFKAALVPSTGSGLARANLDQNLDAPLHAHMLSPPSSSILPITPSLPLSVTSSTIIPPPLHSSTPPRSRLPAGNLDAPGSPSSSAFDLSSIAFERGEIPVAIGDSSVDSCASAESTMYAGEARTTHKPAMFISRTTPVPDPGSMSSATATGRTSAAPTPPATPRPVPHFILTPPPIAASSARTTTSPGPNGIGSGSVIDTIDARSHPSSPPTATASASISGSEPPAKPLTPITSQCIFEAMRSPRPTARCDSILARRLPASALGSPASPRSPISTATALLSLQSPSSAHDTFSFARSGVGIVSSPQSDTMPKVGLRHAAAASRPTSTLACTATAKTTATGADTDTGPHISPLAYGLDQSKGLGCTNLTARLLGGDRGARPSILALQAARIHSPSHKWAVPRSWNQATSSFTASTVSLDPDTYRADPDRDNLAYPGPSVSSTPPWGSSSLRSGDNLEDEGLRYTEEVERLRLMHARETSALLLALADAQSRSDGLGRCEYDALRFEREALEIECESVRMECDDALRARETLARKHQALLRTHESSLRAHACLEKECEALREQHRTLLVSHYTLQTELHARQSDPQPRDYKTQADFNALSEAYDALASSLGQLDASHTALTTEFTQLAVVYSRLEHEHAELRDAHQNLVVGYGALVRVHERVSARDELEKVQQELEDAVAAARVLRDENAKLRMRMRDIERVIRMAANGEEVDGSISDEVQTGGGGGGGGDGGPECGPSSVFPTSSAIKLEPPPVMRPKRASSYVPSLSVGGPKLPAGGSTKQLRLVNEATTVHAGSSSRRSCTFDSSRDQEEPIAANSDGVRNGEDGEMVRVGHRDQDEYQAATMKRISADLSRDPVRLDSSTFTAPRAALMLLPVHGPDPSDLPSSSESPRQLQSRNCIVRLPVSRNGTFGCGDHQQHLFSITTPEACHVTHQLIIPVSTSVLRPPSEDASFVIPPEADGMSLLMLERAQMDETLDCGGETDGEVDVLAFWGRNAGRFHATILESGLQRTDPSRGALVTALDAEDDDEPTARLVLRAKA